MVASIVTSGVALSIAGFFADASWINILWLFAAGCLIGLGLFIAWQNHTRSDAVAITPIVHTKSVEPFPVEGFVSMQTAVTKLYAELPRRFILERAREQLEGSSDGVVTDVEEQRLKYVAKFIAEKIPVHGKNYQGVFKRIDMNLLRFNADLTTLTHVLYDRNPECVYTDIAVRSDEFDALLEGEGFTSAFQEEQHKMIS